MKRNKKVNRIATGVAAGALLAVGVTGIATSAQAATRSDQSTTSQQALPHGMRDHGGPGNRAHADRSLPVHGETVTKATDGSFVTHVMVSGTVTSVSATSISVKAADDYSATFVINSSTDVRTTSSGGTISDIKVGDSVHVDGTKSGSTITADEVHAGTPGAKPAK
ncbi:MAG: DUF5666 domain-containing protein [Candidatus Nanopelagicales bacterium]